MHCGINIVYLAKVTLPPTVPRNPIHIEWFHVPMCLCSEAEHKGMEARMNNLKRKKNNIATMYSVFSDTALFVQYTVDAQQSVLWIYSSSFISRQQWQLTDLSAGEWHSKAVGNILFHRKVIILVLVVNWNPPVCFWKCINYATKHVSPLRKLFALSWHLSALRFSE